MERLLKSTDFDQSLKIPKIQKVVAPRVERVVYQFPTRFNEQLDFLFYIQSLGLNRKETLQLITELRGGDGVSLGWIAFVAVMLYY